jgi:hypothetical protein
MMRPQGRAEGGIVDSPSRHSRAASCRPARAAPTTSRA